MLGKDEAKAIAKMAKEHEKAARKLRSLLPKKQSVVVRQKPRKKKKAAAVPPAKEKPKTVGEKLREKKQLEIRGE